jgi:hypothetical protein
MGRTYERAFALGRSFNYSAMKQVAWTLLSSLVDHNLSILGLLSPYLPYSCAMSTRAFRYHQLVLALNPSVYVLHSRIDSGGFKIHYNLL